MSYLNALNENVLSFVEERKKDFEMKLELSWACVVEEIKMWKVSGRQVMAKAHVAFGKVS